MKPAFPNELEPNELDEGKVAAAAAPDEAVEAGTAKLEVPKPLVVDAEAGEKVFDPNPEEPARISDDKSRIVFLFINTSLPFSSGIVKLPFKRY